MCGCCEGRADVGVAVQPHRHQRIECESVGGYWQRALSRSACRWLIWVSEVGSSVAAMVAARPSSVTALVVEYPGMSPPWPQESPPQLSGVLARPRPYRTPAPSSLA